MTLRVLDPVQSVYSVPEDDLIGEVIIPGLSKAHEARGMFGFFDSAALKHIAPGLAAFLAERPLGRLQLIASPMVSATDLQAIRDAVEQRDAVLARAGSELLEGARLSEHALSRFSQRCLAYLLASKRLEMRFAAVKEGLFHPKVWLLSDEANAVVVHGSSNLTASGLLHNFETVSVERSWRGADSQEKISRFKQMFDALWHNKDPSAVVISAPDAVRAGLLRESGESAPPTMGDFYTAWRADFDSGREASAPPDGQEDAELKPRPAPRLRLPNGLVIDTGHFSHQGKAVSAWEDARDRGILAMATGSGKTISALVAATRLQNRMLPLLIVIAVPYRPLVKQWAREVTKFGVLPTVLAELSPRLRSEFWARNLRALDLGVTPVSVCVATHEHLVSDEFRRLQERIPKSIHALLIADEVHNLGRPKFKARQPERFDLRLGLSATPERQYDREGTDSLFKYFGPKVFEFSLDDAIGTCLVPYDYDIQRVELTSDEVDRWGQLTNELRRAGFGGAEDAEEAGRLPSKVVRLLVKRRAILEGAENKIAALSRVLFESSASPPRHTLVYATDKARAQLVQVNELLRSRGVLFHQVTEAESSDRRRLQAILDKFADGEIQVLTAKRVLDEGVDIPETQRALLLASSTVRRQWIQRRGRVLRTCDRIGKRRAWITDFVVVPPGGSGGESTGILKQEIARAQEFARLAENAGDPGGAFEVIQELMN